jgi:hypothetical protein
MRSGVAAVALVALPAMMATALAGGDAAGEKAISGSLTTELEYERFYGSGAAINDVTVDIAGAVAVRLGGGFSLTGSAEIEQNNYPTGNGWYFLYDTGVNLDYLRANYGGERFLVYGGFIEPNIFGTDYPHIPALWGTYLVKDAEIEHRAGGGGRVDLGDAATGTHRIEAALFTVNTSWFGGWAFDKRSGRTRRGDGGVGNTNGLKNAWAMLNGGGIPGLDGFTYYLSGTRQAADLIFDSAGSRATDTADEYRARAALQQKVALSNRSDLTLTGDYIRYWNANGFDGARRDYATLGGRLTYAAWYASAYGTRRWIDGENGTNSNDYDVVLTLGHVFESGFDVALEWALDRELGVHQRSVAATISKSFTF